MKELYFTSPYRRSLRTVRLEYGQVKKVFILRTYEGGINGRGTSESSPKEEVFEDGKGITSKEEIIYQKSQHSSGNLKQF